jgi:hypothetical protein
MHGGGGSGKRRETEVFSLAFLDCICCGFGAVLLIFILSVSQQKSRDTESLEEVENRVRQMEASRNASQAEIAQLEQMLAAAQSELDRLKTKNTGEQANLTNRQKELLLLLQQTGALKDALDNLLGEKKALPTEDEQSLPIPNEDRRQYLTGVKFEGTHVLFLVRVSGSMLGDTIDEAITLLEEPDFKKREAPKWQRVLRSLEWMIANLSPETNFQILLFNDETVPLITNRTNNWIPRKDRTVMKEMLTKLHAVVPGGSANLERAFNYVRYMPTLPDSIVLLTDGLPTASDSSPGGNTTDDDTRMVYLRQAVRQLPPRIPVSTILFPTSGDPGAPALYWELAGYTDGALVSPSADWPDT